MHSVFYGAQEISSASYKLRPLLWRETSAKLQLASCSLVESLCTTW